MATVKLNLARMSILDKVALARTVIDKMTDNPDFPTPDPTLIKLGADADTAEEAATAAAVARSASQQATSELYAAEAVLDQTITGTGAYVQKASAGVPAKILGSGLKVRNERTSITSMPAVENLSVTGGDHDGEIDGQFDPVKGARSYEIQSCNDPMTSAGWLLRTAETQSKFTIGGLTSGTRVWFRVRALGPRKIKGPWSDPAVKMVP
jgi:hypothetical protein